MEAMSNNPHHETSVDLIGAETTAGGTFLDPNTQGMMLAQAEATLALAYEQRTANLIAFYGEGPSVPGDPAYAELLGQITKRLGLS